MTGRTFGAAALAALAATLAGPSVAGATVDLTALRIRIGDHPATTRVVVDLTDGTLADRQVESVDPVPLDGRARVRITATRVRTEAARRSAYGVTAGLVQGHGHIDLALAAAPGRFKLISYEVIGSGWPVRLVVDLWKSAPPSAAATILRAPGGCIVLDRANVLADRVSARGRSRGIFEHQMTADLRATDGRVIVRRAVQTNATGGWTRRLPYDVPRSQDATLEVYDLSEKDGALACIVQQRVRLVG